MKGSKEKCELLALLGEAVDSQAENEALWAPVTASEDYVTIQLRRLHQMIESATIHEARAILEEIRDSAP